MFKVFCIVVGIVVHRDRPLSLEGCISLFLFQCSMLLVLGPPQVSSHSNVCHSGVSSTSEVVLVLLCSVLGECASCVCLHLLSSFAFWTTWPYQVGQVVHCVCNFHLDCQHLTDYSGVY